MTKDEAIQTVTVTVHLRDGGEAELKAERIKARNLHLDGSTVHPFRRPEDGSPILFILRDGNGTEFTSERNNVGISIPHLVMGAKNRFGYRTDDIFDARMSNFIPTKDRNKLR
jgi:hypothetical protein